MKVRKYDKLVRDRIPDIITASGSVPVCDRPDKNECLAYLAAKLSEEAAEYRESRDIEELADVIEVVRGILHHNGISWEELESVRQKKYAERGGFEQGIRLIEVVDEP